MFGGNFSPTLAGAPNSRLSEDKSGDDAKPSVEPRWSTRFRWFSYKPPNPQPWLCAKCSRATSEPKQIVVLHRCVYPSDITTYISLFTYIWYTWYTSVPCLFGVKAISWCGSMNVTHSKLPTLRIPVFAYEIRTKIRIDLSYVDAVDVCLCCARSCWRSLAQKKSPHPTPRRPVLARLLRRCQRRLARRGIGALGEAMMQRCNWRFFVNLTSRSIESSESGFLGVQSW